MSSNYTTLIISIILHRPRIYQHRRPVLCPFDIFSFRRTDIIDHIFTTIPGGLIAGQDNIRNLSHPQICLFGALVAYDIFINSFFFFFASFRFLNTCGAHSEVILCLYDLG